MRGWPAAAARSAEVVTDSGLFDAQSYLRWNPDVAQAGVDPLLHFLTVGGREGRRPHVLFDCTYYTAHCPTLAADENPLVHYLQRGAEAGCNPHPLFDTSFYADRYGAVLHGRNPLAEFVECGERAGRCPHPLFDPDFYRSQYPDVAARGLNTLAHYVEHGAAEGRQPHALFDPTFYRTRYPDIGASVGDALLHYLDYGAAEGRDPNPLFCSEYYWTRYPDVAAARVNPLRHYVEHGAREGRRPSARFDGGYWSERHPLSLENPLAAHVRESGSAPLVRPLREHLPVDDASVPAPPPGLEVDVIVPVYRGLAETRRCLESVRAARVDVSWRLIILNDQSPEPAVTEYLRALPVSDSLVLIENERNLGFVATVNRGMRQGPERDVVLLNSDTEVADGWLDRLAGHAYHARDVATVTPLSNNATICSYPTLGPRPTLPEAETTAHLAALSATVNAGRCAEIPTAVGYCMYIRRECLEAVGLFDEAYGAGYGEENDFCLRAAAAGWRHLLAADVFVFHAGEVSFAEQASRQRAHARRLLLSRYPDYERRIDAHVRADPAGPWRVAITAARYRTGGRAVVLLVTHHLGGGTEKHIADLRSVLHEHARFLILRPGVGRGIVVLESADSADGFRIERDLTAETDEIVALLRSFGVSRVHVHHMLGLPAEVRELHRRLRVPLDFTVHDAYTLCPQFTMTDRAGSYCGEPDASACNECIAERGGAADILWWRESFGWLFRESGRVICPSEDAATRVRRYQPRAPTLVVPHEEPSSRATCPRPLTDGVLRIAVLGTLDDHKGVRQIRDLADAIEARSLPFELVVIGHSIAKHVTLPPSVRVSGPYDDHDLSGLLASSAPHVVWFPGRCPETYSFTLSTALRAGLPIVAPQLGAFPERLRDRAWTRLVNVDLTTEGLIDVLQEIRQELASVAAGPCVATPDRAVSRFYPRSYLTQAAPAPAAASPVSRPRVLLVPETHGGVPGACGYIRLLLPLLHADVRSMMDVSVAAPHEALQQVADVLVLQRLAFRDRRGLEALLDHALRTGQRVVYDLDDDLLSVPDDHPEHDHYAPLSELVRVAVGAADEVWTSTSALAERMRGLARTLVVLPNALDETLWWSELPSAPPPGRIGLLYAGTPTHEADFAMVSGALRRLHQELGDQVSVALVGISPQPLRDPAWRHLSVPPSAAASYPAFVNWFRRMARDYHVGLAPLADKPFNHGKSGIKVLEYAAAGLLPICSDVGPYATAVTDGADGILVRHEDEWYERLRELIRDADRRARLAKGAGETVMRRGRLAPLARQRLGRLQDLVNHPRTD
jgi:GT2 family glycosyltransferase/glycosyltransferase involved in cell wall biosynthesis